MVFSPAEMAPRSVLMSRRRARAEARVATNQGAPGPSAPARKAGSIGFSHATASTKRHGSGAASYPVMNRNGVPHGLGARRPPEKAFPSQRLISRPQHQRPVLFEGDRAPGRSSSPGPMIDAPSGADLHSHYVFVLNHQKPTSGQSAASATARSSETS